MSTKLVLDTQDITDSFFEEARLLGIMTPLKDYQLCWQINQMLSLDFRINNELEIQLAKKGRNYFFAIYEYAEPASFLTHYLYNNQFDGEYLLPEFRHLDFLWLVKGDLMAEDSLRQIIQSVRAVNSVQLVVELTNEKIKNRENLIF